jgi:Pin2-interacting protein X1
MEKYGWSKGKGLGAKEQGEVDHITVQHKDDNKGIGCTGHDSTWIAHQDDFASVLAALNQTHGSSNGGTPAAESKVNSEGESGDDKEDSGETLEQKSKKMKKRVQ